MAANGAGELVTVDSAVRRRLRTDAAGVDVIRALHEAGIDVILLKGPVTAAWLYPGEARSYVDIDLLVAPDDLHRARTVIMDLGFVPTRSCPVGGEQELCRSADETTIDLHDSLKEIGIAPPAAWRVLRERVVPFPFHGQPVLALDVPSRLVHACTHALQTGATKDKAKEDLRRAIEHVRDDEWRRALVVASALDAVEPLRIGLRLYGDTAGNALADDLGLGRRVAVLERLRAHDRSGVLAMVRKLVRADAAGRRALVRGWVRPERARMERRLQRHDVPHWIRRRPATQSTMLLLLPVLVGRGVVSVVRGVLRRRR